MKQTDFDGKFTYSKMVAVNYEGPMFASLQVYPNPFVGKKITVEIKGLKNVREVPVQMFNLQGQKIMDRVLTIRNPGLIKEDLIFDSPLPSGLYIIKAGPTLKLTQKVVVE